VAELGETGGDLQGAEAEPPSEAALNFGDRLRRMLVGPPGQLKSDVIPVLGWPIRLVIVYAITLAPLVAVDVYVWPDSHNNLSPLIYPVFGFAQFRPLWRRKGALLAAAVVGTALAVPLAAYLVRYAGAGWADYLATIVGATVGSMVLVAVTHLPPRKQPVSTGD
jgi:hypothetical protein